jgi:hypothetical protein
MKSKIMAIIIGAAVCGTLLFENIVYALTTYERICLTIRVVKVLSLKLDNEVLHQNFDRPEAEAFSELKEDGILIDRLKKDNLTVWLFTKTE